MIAALLFLIIDKKPDFMSGFLSIKCQGQGLEKIMYNNLRKLKRA